jgi:NAD(P) transhydrogenase subunit alpha
MTIFVPRESREEEGRVALIPPAVKKLVAGGTSVLVERSAGQGAGWDDPAYESAGGQICGAEGWGSADIVVVVDTPAAENVRRMKRGSVLAGMVHARSSPDLVQACKDAGVSLLALELLPRITRAQSIDTLSSQANLAGYKAVIIAAAHLPRVFPMMMTAAGTIQPARVFVIGAGVAGLQAIATAKRLGAVVSAFDLRSAVREQVQSVGARFVELPIDARQSQGTGGYAGEQSAEQQRLQQELMSRHVAESDVVITTAAVPGKPAPRLIPASAVEKMAYGSVIVDLAASTGGNCELTRPGETVRHGGVTVVGLTDLPSRVSVHASQVYSGNMMNLLSLIVAKDGSVKLDSSDEVIAGILVCREGETVHPAFKAQTPA